MTSKKHLIALILVLVLTSLIPPTPAFSEIHINSIEINPGNPLKNKDKIQKLIPFATGQTLSEEKFQDSINLLKNLNFFKTVDYQLQRQGSGYRLILNLTTGQKVRGVSVRGNYPILGKNITKLIALQPGTVFDQTLLPQAEQSVIDYLQKFGFYHSTVNIEVKPVKKFDVVDLLIKIKKGKTYRVGTVEVKGNQVLSTRKIQNHFRHFSRFQMVRFKKDLKKLKKIYSRKGHIKARVKLEKISFDEEKKRVNLKLIVRENKKLFIKITGKTFFKKSRLKSITQLKERRSYDQYAIRNGKRRLEQYYKKHGFPNINVSYDIIKKDDEKVIIEYKILSGKRVEVKNIKIKGNKSISDKKLKKAIRAEESELFTRVYFNKKKITRNQMALSEIYRNQGYFNIKVDDPVIVSNRLKDQRKITFPVNEGQRFTIGEILFDIEDYDADVKKLTKISTLKSGKPFEAQKLIKATTRVLDYIQAQGFAYAGIFPETNIDHDNHVINITFKAKYRHKAYIKSITLDGHLLTHRKTILRNLKIKEGDLFSYQKMLDAQLNLRKLGIFSSVRITPIGFDLERENIDLHINVIERKSVIVNIQGGLDTQQIGTGQFSFTKLNLFGGARQLNLRAIGGRRYSRGEITFFSPRVFGASWNFSNQYFMEFENQPNFDALSYGGFVNTLKNFGPYWTFGFKEQITRTNLFESRSNVTALGNALFDNTFNEFQLTGILDLRDNFSDPQKGILLLARNELNTDLSDVKNNFDILELNLSHYQGFLKRFTLVNTFRFANTFRISSSPRIPANKLFFLGGADTLRGFTEDGINPAGGTMMLIYNGELQFKMTDSFKLAGFFDAGLLGNDFNDIKVANFRESAGVGLRYFTPIGPLRLDWGFILDRFPGEPKSRVHFSFGYFF